MTKDSASGFACAQIQADLSAMLDGELEGDSGNARVRRVMVHSEACPDCKRFLASIRAQARAHQELGNAGLAVEAATPEGAHRRLKLAAAASDGGSLGALLLENRGQLAMVLYELGRGFALMGLSPEFSREVAKEPVPIPDMSLRGRNLVGELEREARARGESDSGWVDARELFEPGALRSQEDNLGRADRLLTECLELDPDHHEARIYLAMVCAAQDRLPEARTALESVLRRTELSGGPTPTVGMTANRAYALLNLGNVYMEEGDCPRAIELFMELVDSGAASGHPRFGMVYFNLALAHGYLGEHEVAIGWFNRLHQELPHKRPMIGRELATKREFLEAIAQQPGFIERLAKTFPAWFATPGEAI